MADSEIHNIDIKANEIVKYNKILLKTYITIFCVFGKFMSQT